MRKLLGLLISKTNRAWFLAKLFEALPPAPWKFGREFSTMGWLPRVQVVKRMCDQLLLQAQALPETSPRLTATP